MALAPGLTILTLVRPGGLLTTVVVRRPRKVVTKPEPAVARRVDMPSINQEPCCAAGVPLSGGAPHQSLFSLPIVRALAALGSRVRSTRCDDVLLDGRRVPLVRIVAEANRCLEAAGRRPIVYPGLPGAGGR